MRQGVAQMPPKLHSSRVAGSSPTQWRAAFSMHGHQAIQMHQVRLEAFQRSATEPGLPSTLAMPMPQTRANCACVCFCCGCVGLASGDRTINAQPCMLLGSTLKLLDSGPSTLQPAAPLQRLPS